MLSGTGCLIVGVGLSRAGSVIPVLGIFCDSVGSASPGIAEPARKPEKLLSPAPAATGIGSPLLGACRASQREPGIGSFPIPLSTAPAATSSQFGTASVCVLLFPSIVQLMLKSILVLILGHD